MKLRKLTGYIVLISFVLIFLGFRTAMDPLRFTGRWYATQSGDVFLFSEGLILLEKTDKQENAIVGAYIFTRDKILVSLYYPANSENLYELCWIHRSQGDILCKNQDGSETVYFSRTPLLAGQ